ncbi:hypothetical protein SNOG_08929 [Parastagonospora nodorum SN15]|uniref:Uncharacterized protein n=1 Tax=Phaeosphaeria nodorum (strain SN15 / ATCC MYA-4574 / FGSC 10173) TaxID=321614 RepID=Q0UH35_PHANO|nr:hypothetical protein SNOG_08929 [Parastagonospora nodorum SN15]EAT84097.1 hypothetical protein SNOG_08929 [Parastagonospora nodorum SN15]
MWLVGFFDIIRLQSSGNTMHAAHRLLSIAVHSHATAGLRRHFDDSLYRTSIVPMFR